MGPPRPIAVLHCDSPVLALTSMRLLGRRGIRSVLVTQRPRNYARHSRHCVAVYGCAGLREETAAERVDIAELVAATLRRHAPAVLLPLTTEAVLLAACHHELLAAAGAVPPPAPVESIQAVIDKGRFAALVERLGVPTPRTGRAHDRAGLPAALEAVGLPAVIKPAGNGPKHLVRRLSDLDAIAPGGPWVVQELIEGDDVDCSLLALNGRVSHALCQTNLRNHESLDGLPVAVRAVDSPEAHDLASRLAAELRWSGLAHIDMRHDRRRDRLVVFELNPRLWASHLFAERAAGFDAPHLLYQQALGEQGAQLRTPDTATTYVAPRTLLRHPLSGLAMLPKLQRPRLYPTVTMGDLSDPLPVLRRTLPGM